MVLPRDEFTKFLLSIFCIDSINAMSLFLLQKQTPQPQGRRWA
ncbi:hypothetical protein KKY_1231 [Pelagibacterium halotolerans B2]|uniref:Uncharacterized protein n=1 Tax=Pelagibacterium halotolerans (strain DSM 22347 / JCM 15775 / CGMCC 1.7692 / B2) TaxID=1082931 RepID=G4R7C3_PELHB|nr:hypothetical protein KKY_1231 [Pelagibacterium halotolerans B2]